MKIPDGEEKRNKVNRGLDGWRGPNKRDRGEGPRGKG